MRKIQIAREAGQWTKALEFPEALKEVRRRETGDGPFTLGKRGDEELVDFGDIDALLKGLRERAHRPDPVLGDVFLIRDSRPTDTAVDLLFRVVEVENVANICGTPFLKRFHAALYAIEEDLNYWGGYADRNIGSTGTPSQHNACPPNAGDYNGSKREMDHVWRVLTADHGRKCKQLDVAHLIYDRKIWTPSEGVHVYDVPAGGSPHTDHLHGDGNPQKGPVHGGCDCK